MPMRTRNSRSSRFSRAFHTGSAVSSARAQRTAASAEVKNAITSSPFEFKM